MNGGAFAKSNEDRVHIAVTNEDKILEVHNIGLALTGYARTDSGKLVLGDKSCLKQVGRAKS
jgi:hypothetical protein